MPPPGRGALDLSQPIAVLLIGVLHFIPDDDPYARSAVKIRLRSRDEVARLLDGLEPVGRGVVRLDQWWDADPMDAETASGVAG